MLVSMLQLRENRLYTVRPFSAAAGRCTCVMKRVSPADSTKILLICVSYTFCISPLRDSWCPGTRSIDYVDNKLLFFVLPFEILLGNLYFCAYLFDMA